MDNQEITNYEKNDNLPSSICEMILLLKETQSQVKEEFHSKINDGITEKKDIDSITEDFNVLDKTIRLYEFIDKGYKYKKVFSKYEDKLNKP